MIGALVAEALRSAPVADVMKHLGAVALYDRYQASLGIHAAAAVVAGAARELGLEDVTIQEFTTDKSWWTFEPPTPWTPLRAQLAIETDLGRSMVIDHSLQPFSIATHSTSTPAGGLHGPVRALESGQLQGALVLLDRSEYYLSDTLERLIDGGASGFMTDGTACSTELGQFPGRVELPATTLMFGFSVTPDQLGVVRSWMKQDPNGLRFHSTIDVDRCATMPIVTACLPGTQPGEVWLTAHLCHPRPGANDNASGVAALLGVGDTLQQLRAVLLSGSQGKTVRFFWGPEFTGTAAYLHQRLASQGTSQHPHAIINLDMVGESVSLCGSPFIVEHGPDFQGSLMAAVAEQVVDEVFAQTANQPGYWRRAPFYGYSDHALFAGPNFGCPLVQFAHWRDRFNHSAADTVDKVCETEIRRSIAAATVLAAWAAGYAQLGAEQTDNVIRSWCARTEEWSKAVYAQHQQSAPAWSKAYRSYMRDRCEWMQSQQEVGEPAAHCFRAADASRATGTLLAGFLGPVNVRGMIAHMEVNSRQEVLRMIASDKRVLALLLNYAVRCDGTRTPAQVVRETHFALAVPPDPAQSHFLLNQLINSGNIKLID
ncbi:DUF4910 domain-containing protein [Burkholderia sp. LMG 21824]|uniref:DUF4910 domain-containing protein n=1 Tax=Burkholderia sp. LMG 21824 TaxID=3158172 RepID=UPI003C2FD3C2